MKVNLNLAVAVAAGQENLGPDQDITVPPALAPTSVVFCVFVRRGAREERREKREERR